MSRLRSALAHAFALSGQDSRLEAEDLALLDRIARLLADRELTTPAIFFVESLIPLGFLAGQLVHALTPIIGLVAPPEDIERLARLLERKETPALFIDRLRRAEEEAECGVRRTKSPHPPFSKGGYGGIWGEGRKTREAEDEEQRHES